MNARSIPVVVLNVLFLCAGHTAYCAGGDVVVTLVPERRNVKQFDPLLVKVVVENRGSEEAMIPKPSRPGYSLLFYAELKPNTGSFEVVHEVNDPIGSVRVPDVVLKPQGKLVTYERLFLKTDDDFVFRKYGPYKLFVVLKTEEKEIAKSEAITIAVNSRPNDEQTKIVRESWLLAQTFLPRNVFLATTTKTGHPDMRSYAEKIAALDDLRTTLRPSNLSEILEWRIDLLRLKYGEDVEKDEAQKRLEEIRGKLMRLNEPAHDVLTLLLAQVALDRGDWQAAKSEVRRLKDDSPEKQAILRTIESKQKPPKAID